MDSSTMGGPRISLYKVIENHVGNASHASQNVQPPRPFTRIRSVPPSDTLYAPTMTVPSGSSGMQWAAVTIHLSEMSDPPQMLHSRVTLSHLPHTLRWTNCILISKNININALFSWLELISNTHLAMAMIQGLLPRHQWCEWQSRVVHTNLVVCFCCATATRT